MKKLLLLVCILFSAINVKAAAISSTATGGNWSAGTSWTGGIVPGVACSTDTVTIVAGSTITWDNSGETVIGTAVAGNDALTINGTFDVPYTANTSTLTVKGDIHLNANANIPRWLIGTESNPLLSTNTFTIAMLCGSSRQFLFDMQSAANAGMCKWYGNYKLNISTNAYVARTLNKVTSSSNSVTLDADIQAQIGQVWCIAATESTVQAETMTVVAYQVSPASVTFDRNFTYTHSSGTTIGLLSRNIVFTSSNTTYQGWLDHHGNPNNNSYNPIVDWHCVQTKNLGNTGLGFYMEGMNISLSSCSWESNGQVQFYVGYNMNIDNAVFFGANGTTIPQLEILQFAGCTFNNLYFFGIHHPTSGNAYLLKEAGSGNTYTNCFFSGAAYAMYHKYSGNTFNNPTMQCLGNGEIITDGTCYPGLTINNGTYRNLAVTPTYGTNIPASFISPYGSTYFDVTLNNHYTYYSSTAAAGSGYGIIIDTYFSKGSKLKIQSFQNTIGFNKCFGNGWVVQTDTTTVYEVGNSALACHLGWNSSSLYRCQDPCTITFTVPNTSNNTILFRGYVRKNTSYGSSSLPSVALSSSDGTLSASATMTDVNDTWQLITCAGTVTSTGTVTVTLTTDNPSKTANSIAYWDSLRVYVGNNVYSLGQNWVSGYPTASPVASTVDSKNMWNDNDNTYPAGTKGNQLYKVYRRDSNR